jgi:hypothetical protein
MSTWVERFKTHVVWQRLEELGPSIDAALRVEGLSIEQRDNLERIRIALTYVGKRLDAADPALCQPPAMDAIAENLRVAITNLTAFPASADNNLLSSASTQLDSALHQVAVGVLVPGARSVEGLSSLVAVYRQSMTEQLREFLQQHEGSVAQAKALEGKLNELEAVSKAELQRLGNALADWQTQFSAAQAAREQANATQVSSFQEQFSGAQGARETAHSDAQTKREERFNDLLTQYTKSLSDQSADFVKSSERIKAEHSKSVSELTTDYEVKASGILESLEQKRQEVEKLANVIGNVGLTAGHTKAANSALYAMRFWQTVAVGAMMFLAYVAFAKFLPAAERHEAAAIAAAADPKHPKTIDSRGFDWSGFAIRIYVSLTVGALAAYAGSQADKYYKIERKNRKLALELEAIGPFLAPLPEEEQRKFRLTIGDRSFGRDDEPGSETSPTTALQLLNTKDGRELLAEVAKLLKSDS